MVRDLAHEYPPSISAVSNSAADRAAETFRKYIEAAHVQEAGGRKVRSKQRAEALAAIAVIRDYRAMHAYPLRKVTMGVRVMLATELGSLAPRPGQRFKRMDRILGKLLRYPTMRLSQMEDIGGCRAVLDDLRDLYAVARRIRRRWPHARVIDHVSNPKADGYRAIHIVERRDGRLIEVQLRTARQQRWAEAVEDALALTGHDIKNGEGPDDLRFYFELAALRLALEDEGQPRDPALEREFARVREEIRHYYSSH